MADLREYPTHLGLNVVFFASDLLAYGGTLSSVLQKSKIVKLKKVIRKYTSITV